VNAADAADAADAVEVVIRVRNRLRASLTRRELDALALLCNLADRAVAGRIEVPEEER